MTRHLPEEHSARLIDWPPFVIIGNAMPPPDPGGEDKEEEEEDDEQEKTRSQTGGVDWRSNAALRGSSSARKPSFRDLMVSARRYSARRRASCISAPRNAWRAAISTRSSV